VPIGGEVTGPLAGAPGAMSAELNAIVRERGGAPIEAAVKMSELEAIIGCGDDSQECLENIAAAMGVEQVVLGEITSSSNESLEVKLTLFRAGQETLRGSVKVNATSVEEATRLFGSQVRDLFDNKAPTDTPEDQPPADQPPADQPPADPIAQPPPTGPTSPAFSFGRVKPYSYAVAGGGVALIGVGAVFYALASGKQSDIDDAPTDTLEDLQALQDLEDSGKRYALLGNISTIVGGIAAATGVTLIVIQGTRKEGPPAAAIEPMALPGGAGLTFTVRGDL
jgi:hypothetical protein